MKVTKDKVENNQAFLTVEMEPGEMAQSLEQAYERLVKRANIPGFRKGKAPRAIFERYLGKESLVEDAVRYTVPQAYDKAVSEQELKAIAEPQIEVVQTEPLIFKATVPLAPVVKLGDYHSIRLTPETVTVTDDKVAATIEQLRHQYATWEPAERPVEPNDLLNMDIESSVEGQPFINRKGMQYQVLSEAIFPVKGFADQLVVMTRDQEKEFKLTFPEDYPQKDRVGKEASFKVKINEIKQEKLPELNDDFAKMIDPELATVDALKQKATDQIKLMLEQQAQLEYEEKLMDEATKMSEVQYPPVLVEDEISRLLTQQLRRIQSSGIDLEQYLKSLKKTPEQLREELRPDAAKRVTRFLVLGKVAEEEKITVTPAEIDAEVEQLARTGGEKEDELRKSLNDPHTREHIEELLVTRKTVSRLTEIAKGPVTGSEVKKEETNDQS